MMEKRSLCLQLLLGLLLMIGTIPEGSEGTKCYSCSGPTCANPTANATKKCEENEGACFKSDLGGSMKRGCYSHAKVACFDKTVGGKCYNENDHASLKEKLEKCIRESVEGGEGTEAGAIHGNTCVCTGDLCNEGPVAAATAPAGAPAPAANAGTGDKQELPVDGGKKAEPEKRLECYCKGNDCKGPIIYCDNEVIGYSAGAVIDIVCYNKTEDGETSRGCLPKPAFICLKKFLEERDVEGDCVTIPSMSDVEMRGKFEEKWINCLTESLGGTMKQRKGGLGVQAKSKQCMCSTNRCNGEEVRSPFATGSQPKRASTSGALIFTGLAFTVAAIYR